MSHPSMKVRVVKRGEPIDLRPLGEFKCEIRPIECLVSECIIKPDGAFTDQGDDVPSLCFVLVDREGVKYFAQVSAPMLTPALEELVKLTAGVR